MFEFIVFAVFIVISILSELSKNKDKKQDEEVDLESLEDFFKKRPSEPAQTQSSVSSRSGEFQSLEEPVQGGRFGSSETSFPDNERASIGEFQSPGGLPPIPAEESSGRQDGKRKQKRGKKQGKPAQHGQQPHRSSEGECLDQAQTLEGMSLEKMPLGALPLSSARPPVSLTPRPRGKPAWNRRRFMDAIIMSELLQRYDLNRVFGRLPQVRKD